MVHGEFNGDCKPVKTRLDKLLVDRGMTPSRERAQALILAGKVLVNEQKIEKAGASVESGCAVRLLGEDIRYVSRGGLKLEKALDHWAEKIRRWDADGLDVLVYFDNDAKVHAPFDALALQERLGITPPGAAPD